jgi:Xaa-Pro aminopeptidase
VSGAIPVSRYSERLKATVEQVRQAGLRALLIGVGPELAWLTGYHAIALERLTMLVVPAEGPVALVVPRLEVSRASEVPAVAAGAVPLHPWTETEDPVRLVRGLVPGQGASGSGLAVSDTLRASFLLRLQDAFRGAPFGVASGVMGPLRSVKDADEVELLRAAAHAADRTVLAIASGRLVGRTEADVAREVRERLVVEGHDEAAFWIVASGPNSASGHHEPGDRVIGSGEPIVLDIGGRIAGYCSDITRTIWVTGGDDAKGPDTTFRSLHGLVQEAQAIGRERVRPGVAAQELDRAARRVIDEGGHGEHFLHRLGHGIGLEVHEDPYLVEGNQEQIRVGQTFSVEPGIYLEGRYGARIEDIVVCGPNGADVLNHAPRDLMVVSGT